jgi:hypothetical protein
MAEAAGRAPVPPSHSRPALRGTGFGSQTALGLVHVMGSLASQTRHVVSSHRPITRIFPSQVCDRDLGHPFAWRFPMAPFRVIPRTLRGAAALLLVTAGCGGSVANGRADGGSPSDATMPSDDDSSLDATPGTHGDAASHDAGATCPSIGDASPVAPVRVPMNHRSSAIACTTPRAAVTPVACGCLDGGTGSVPQPDGSVCLCGSCAQDSDCTQGANGRCEELSLVPSLSCSYDECATDSDCEGGVPCTCRPTATFQNFCQTGSACATDSDCGPGGYCSPSVLNAGCSCLSTRACGDSGAQCLFNGVPVPCECGDSCAHGYYCHTPCDTCMDDSDCTHVGNCVYDTDDRRWECEYCLPHL